MDILPATHWADRDSVPPNLDSDLPWEEHVRVTKEAATLLAGFTDATRWSEGKSVGDSDLSELRARSAFGELKKFFEGGSKKVVYVLKGIHQPSKPHITLSLADKGKEGDGWWFHLDLDLERVSYAGFSAVTKPQDAGRFVYKPRRLTLRPPKDEKAVSAKVYIWPKEMTTTTAITKGGHGRRLSISLAAHNDRLVALDEAKTAH